MEIKYIRKEDIDQLWDIHCAKGVYIFNDLKPCAHKKDILDNFYAYFGNRNDYMLREDGQIVGACSLNRIMWKNGSCNISCQLFAPDSSAAFLEGFSRFLSYLRNDLNLHTVRTVVDEEQLKEWQQLKLTFGREGILREHIFKNGKYTDVHIIAINLTEMERQEQ